MQAIPTIDSSLFRQNLSLFHGTLISTRWDMASQWFFQFRFAENQIIEVGHVGVLYWLEQQSGGNSLYQLYTPTTGELPQFVLQHSVGGELVDRLDDGFARSGRACLSVAGQTWPKEGF